MGHNISSSRQDGPAYIISTLGSSAHDLNLGSLRREQAEGQRTQAQQQHDRDPNQNPAPCPRRRLAITGAQRAINAQAAKIFMFRVNRHIKSAYKQLLLSTRCPIQANEPEPGSIILAKHSGYFVAPRATPAPFRRAGP